MNRKVLLIMLILCGTILVSIYIAKFIFTDWVIKTATSPELVKIGNFIDNNVWADILISSLINFVNYYLILGACLQRLKLKWFHLLVIVLFVGIGLIIQYFFAGYLIVAGMVMLIVLPAIFNSKIRILAIVFTFHMTAQFLSLEIRDIGLNIANTNYATFLILMIDVYIWLILFYLYFNYTSKKEVKQNGKNNCSTLQQYKAKNNRSKNVYKSCKEK